MKNRMKKSVAIILLLGLAGSTSASSIYWTSMSGQADGVSWDSVGNWSDKLTYSMVPGSSDSVFIEYSFFSWENPTMPVISTDMGSVQYLGIASSYAPASLTIVPGGQLVVTGVLPHVDLGNGGAGVATLTMTGGSLDAGEFISVGMNWTDGAGGYLTGSGIIDMSGDSSLKVKSLGFAQLRAEYDPSNPNLDGTGYLYMTGNARLIVEGSATGFNWIDSGAISAPAGNESVVAAYNVASNTTEFSVVDIGYYNVWATGLGLDPAGAGAETNDLEPDGLDNLAEYAFGGNPTNDDAATISPFIDSTGTNFLTYVYRRRNDAALRKLDYSTVAKLDLADEGWFLDGIETGSAPINSAFDSVTNEISTAGFSRKFITVTVSAGDDLFITLTNPTGWTGEFPIEIPVGRIATPGLIDWSNVRLLYNDEEIPFAIREGKAHWKSGQIAPVSQPRAEDLLVFSTSVAPGESKVINIQKGASILGMMTQASPMAIPLGGQLQIAVDYDKIQAQIDMLSGALLSLTFEGRPLLDTPFSIEAFTLGLPGYSLSGTIAPGYVNYNIGVLFGQSLSSMASLESYSFNPVFTELNFTVSAGTSLEMALTYRIHASGYVEIAVDDKSPQGANPWPTTGVDYSLELAGQPQNIGLLEERTPYFGFKDFAATFRQIACVNEAADFYTVELGEEMPNGRRFFRRIFPSLGDPSLADGLIEAMDDGFIVQPRSETVFFGLQPVEIVADSTNNTIAVILRTAIQGRGLEAGIVLAGSGANTIQLQLVQADASIDGDGFSIGKTGEGGIVVSAKTRFGLYSAVNEIVEHLSLGDSQVSIPLVSRNPVVPHLGIGLGGGANEVDFPHGPDGDWQYFFDQMLNAGVNRICSLGMWSNWKMPVSYMYMPELQSNAADAYDESTGVLLSEYEPNRDHGLALAEYLKDRGATVDDWVPIGVIPTTFAEVYPEALAPTPPREFSGRLLYTPCFTHPKYHDYLVAFLQELIETYPIDGLILIRDDNGGICNCEECLAYVAASATQSATWEQYLIIHSILRNELGFQGEVQVYPYFDGLTPEIEQLLPEDMVIVGHGGSVAALTRSHELVGHMPETWLDNLYSYFRLPSSARMKRLVQEKGIFTLGGAFQGTELPWEAIGRFGWEPTATPNTLRYEWGKRSFGTENAMQFVHMNDLYEELWEINARYLLPKGWLGLSPIERADMRAETLILLGEYSTSLATLKAAVSGIGPSTEWFAYMELFPYFMKAMLERSDMLIGMHDTVYGYIADINVGTPLPSVIRTTLLDDYENIYVEADNFLGAMQLINTPMLNHCQGLTHPYAFFVAGYFPWALDPFLAVPQFDGTIAATLLTTPVVPGQAFQVEVVLLNNGIIPWTPRGRTSLILSGPAEGVSLPPEWNAVGTPIERWQYVGDPIAPGDTYTFTINAMAPDPIPPGGLTLKLIEPVALPTGFAEATLSLP